MDSLEMWNNEFHYEIKDQQMSRSDSHEVYNLVRGKRLSAATQRHMKRTNINARAGDMRGSMVI